MATVASTIKMFDAMTGPLKSITSSMNIMISTMHKMQDATNRNTNIDKSLMMAKRQVAAAEVEINRQINASKQAQENFNNSVKQSKSNMRDLSILVIVLNQGLELVKKTWGIINTSMGLADVMSATNSRLALVNDGLRTNAELQKQVLDVANRTRQGYVETAGLVTKLGAGTQGIFKNDDELLKFTERFNKSLVISGATAVESSSAILQMSQALGSGVLQGDELRSLSETAPVMMRILSDGLGIARGELKSMGAAGELTADKIVAAFQSQSDKIDTMFEQMPMTFGGAMTVLTNYFKTWFGSLNEVGGPLTQITEKVQQLTAYLQSDAGQQLMDGLANGIANAVGWLIQMVELAARIYTFFSDNWTIIEAVVWGVVGAIAAWTVAQWALNIALSANPIGAIIMAIVVVIGLIIFLVKWLINLWNTNDKFAAGLLRAWNSILNFFDQIPIFFTRIGHGIANAFDWAKVTSLEIMQDLVNGVIDDLNELIGVLNKIPGVNLDTVSHVSFAASEAAEAEARKQAREESLKEMEQNAKDKAAAREQKVVDMLDDRASKRAKKQAEKDAKGERVPGGGTSLFSPDAPPINGGTIDKVNKVGKIEDKVDISSEDLKTMRELAEMKSIQNFVSLTPTVQVTTGPVNNGADIDTIVARIEQTLEEEIAASAAGVYA